MTTQQSSREHTETRPGRRAHEQTSAGVAERLACPAARLMASSGACRRSGSPAPRARAPAARHPTIDAHRTPSPVRSDATMAGRAARRRRDGRRPTDAAFIAPSSPLYRIFTSQCTYFLFDDVRPSLAPPQAAIQVKTRIRVCNTISTRYIRTDRIHMDMYAQYVHEDRWPTTPHARCIVPRRDRIGIHQQDASEDAPTRKLIVANVSNLGQTAQSLSVAA